MWMWVLLFCTLFKILFWDEMIINKYKTIVLFPNPCAYIYSSIVKKKKVLVKSNAVTESMCTVEF